METREVSEEQRLADIRKAKQDAVRRQVWEQERRDRKKGDEH